LNRGLLERGGRRQRGIAKSQIGSKEKSKTETLPQLRRKSLGTEGKQRDREQHRERTTIPKGAVIRGGTRRKLFEEGAKAFDKKVPGHGERLSPEKKR